MVRHLVTIILLEESLGGGVQELWGSIVTTYLCSQFEQMKHIFV